MSDQLVAQMLEVAICKTSPQGEKNAALNLVGMVLEKADTTITQLLSAPRLSVTSTAGQMQMAFDKKVLELRASERREALLIEQVKRLGGTATEIWIATADFSDPLPEPEKPGFYSWELLESLCIKRLGTNQRWQASVSIALMIELGEFRANSLLDFQRHKSRSGVPVEVVRLMQTTQHLKVSKLHKWTDRELELVKYLMSPDGGNLRDAQIVSRLWKDIDILVTSESIRAHRMRFLRESKVSAQPETKPAKVRSDHALAA